ncbi:hypothetical protein CR513_60697, partial [Mucuna pruriens]
MLNKPKQKPQQSIKKKTNACWNYDTKESSSSKEEYKDDNFIYQIEQDTTSKKSKALDDKMCLGPKPCTCSDCKTINVLIKGQIVSTLIYLIIENILGDPNCFFLLVLSNYINNTKCGHHLKTKLPRN